MQEQLIIKKIAVLGAGVMGAQIAAHCVNAGIETCLYDLAADDKNSNAIVDKAIKHLGKIKPSPLAESNTTHLIQGKNYQDDLSDLSSCDLIIEAIAEKLEWKKDLYHRIAPHMSDDAILVTNTSGLSINHLAKSLPEELKHKFCGVHFFNPPRYMHLAELIPSNDTPATLMDNLETWLTRYLGKGIVRAKDTPNFIANRVGVFSLLATIHNASKFQLGFDTVDAITGALIGRPKSATFRTMDVVGLDTMSHVVSTMKKELEQDPWHSWYQLPSWLNSMIESGHLGQKSKQGIYRKNGQVIEVYDLESNSYRPSKPDISDELKRILKERNLEKKMNALFSSSDKQARFLSACYYDLFHYCAYHLNDIADTARDVDLAMRWGFGWTKGPFEIWQLSGKAFVTNKIKESISNDDNMSSAKLPEWVDETHAFYEENGSFSPKQKSFLPRSQLAIYQRQYFPDRVLSEPSKGRETVYENEALHLWHLEEGIAVVSFKTKANTINRELIDGFNEALNHVHKSYSGLIVYQDDENNFSAGADLQSVATPIQKGQFDELESMIHDFQKLAMRIKYSMVPVVAALRGRALGGGCELLMHCTGVAAGFESYPGLVEMGVGLIPAGGGIKELALRCFEQSPGDLTSNVKKYFELIAMAQVSSSAVDAKSKGFLRAHDTIVMHKNEVLNSAVSMINHFNASNYLPPMKRTFKVAGQTGQSMLQVGLVNWLKGGFISQHDYDMASYVASILCGGDVAEGQDVDENWLLKLEREAFIKLSKTEKTQERIKHLLETGKPLRN